MGVDFPESIGPFPPERLVGRGAMAAVYLAREPGGEPVAVKWMNRPHPPWMTRFAREVEALSRIKHPGVVGYRAHGSHEGRPYLVTDFVEGSDLRLLTEKLHQRPSAERYRRCRELGHELALALAYVHEQGLVHRDLKPSNVLIDQDGHAVLSDFGVVKDLGEEDHTGVGLLVGTVAYAAPEQLLCEAVDPRTDLYGLGATLYYVLTGQPPYRTVDRQTLPPPPSRVDPGVPPELEAVVMRLLALSPAHRYPTADAAARALASEGEGDPMAQAPLPVAGRRDALAALSAALDRADRGEAILIRPRGPRGAGQDWLFEVLSSQARRRKLAVVALDDAELAPGLWARVAHGEALVVLSSLSIEVPPGISVVELELAPLGPADVRRTLVGFAPATRSASEQAAELHRLTGGLPGLLRPVLEAGIKDGRFHLPSEEWLAALGDEFLGPVDLDEIEVLGLLALSRAPLSAAAAEGILRLPVTEHLLRLEDTGLVLRAGEAWVLSAEVLVEPVVRRLPDPEGLEARIAALQTEGAAERQRVLVEAEVDQAEAALLDADLAEAEALARRAHAWAGAFDELSLEARATRVLGDVLRVLGVWDEAGRLLADATALARAAGEDRERRCSHALRALVALDERPGRRAAAASAIDRVLPLMGRDGPCAFLLSATWCWAAEVLGDRRTGARARALALASPAEPSPVLRLHGWRALAEAALVCRDTAALGEAIDALEASGGELGRMEATALRARAGQGGPAAASGAALSEERQKSLGQRAGFGA